MSNEPKADTSIRVALRELFAIDVRSLALLRMVVAVLILYSLFSSISTIEAFYGAEGVLPLELNQHVVKASGEGFWSVYWISDSINWLWLCIGVTSLAAFSLLLGFRTWVATAVCLVMMWSLQVRNPLVLTAGDVLLRMVLFWGLFLPWGQVWSLDRQAKSEHKKFNWKICSWASAAMMLQLAYIYFFSGIAKLMGEWSSTALIQSLQLEMYVKPFGNWLSVHVPGLDWVPIVVVVLEIAGSLFLFVPWICHYWRGTMMALMWLMHVSIAMSMSIGIFSAMAMAMWIIFVPSSVWNRLMGTPLGFERESKTATSIQTKITQSLCGVFLVFVMLVNIMSFWNPSEEPGALRSLGVATQTRIRALANATMTQQEFKMFAYPPTSNPWPQYAATTEEGDPVDVFSTQFGDTQEKPASVYRYMKTHYWRRYHLNLVLAVKNQEDPPPLVTQLRRRLLAYHVEQWNGQHSSEEKVVYATLVMNQEALDSDGHRTGESEPDLWATWGEDQ